MNKAEIICERVRTLPASVLDNILEHIDLITKNNLNNEKEDLFFSNRVKKMRQARGLWKDRQDLPDFRELRKEWDRLNIG